MSGQRGFWNDGQPNTTVDHQRVADAAASADDLIRRVLLQPFATGGVAYGKGVTPFGQLIDAANHAMTAPLNTMVLAVPSVTAGQVLIRPCTFTIGAADKFANLMEVPDAMLNADLMEGATTPPFASAVSNNRIDVVYALVTRAATTGPRKIKDTVTGVVNTQTITVAEPVTITIGVQLGSEAGSPLAPPLPADSSTAWYVKLAEVYLPLTFTAGTAILQTQIKQKYDRIWLTEHTVRDLNAISFTGVSGVQKGGDDTPETNVSARFGAHLKIGLELRYVSTMAAYCNLDGLRDWSHRWVRICICRTSDQGGPTNYPQLSTITGAATGSGAISYDSGWLFTGGGDNIFLTHSFGGSDPDFAFKALESSTGQMQMRIYTNGPVGTADYYWVTVEATDQFVAP